MQKHDKVVIFKGPWKFNFCTLHETQVNYIEKVSLLLMLQKALTTGDTLTTAYNSFSQFGSGLLLGQSLELACS